MFLRWGATTTSTANGAQAPSGPLRDVGGFASHSHPAWMQEDDYVPEEEDRHSDSHEGTD